MDSYKDRLEHSQPVFNDMLRRGKPPIRKAILGGASAGVHTVSDIKAGDQVVAVTFVDFTTPGLSDITGEFNLKEGNIAPSDGQLDNTGGTDTSGEFLEVTWIAWAE